LAVNFYNLATEQGSISTVIANVLGLGSIWATTGISCVICTEFFIVTAIQTVAIIVVIVTFSYIAMLMLVRSVVLIFLMVLSPIGFMGTVLPKLAEYSKMWWENLYGQVFVAPIFLLLFYLITKIGNSLSLGSAMITDFVGPMTPEETAKIAQENAAYTQYFKYILIIILLFAAVKITKKMSGVVGGAVEGFAKFAAGAAVGAVTGGAALALRRTVGARAQTMTEDQGLKDRAAAGDRGAMLQLATAKKMAGASFDVRATDTFKKTTGFIGDQTGLKVDYGAGVAIQKGGYVGTIKEKEKKAEEEAKYMTEGIKVKDEEIMAEMDVAARARSEMARLRSIPSRSRDEERMLSEHEEDLKKYNERFKGIEDAKDKKEFMKKVIEKEKKDERLEKLAVREENKITNKIFGGGKEKAKKIRDAKKEKSGAEKLQDAVKQAAEEENKKKAAATATPAAPAPAPAAPPATPPPPPPATP
jgi:hypothetical protein